MNLAAAVVVLCVEAVRRTDSPGEAPYQLRQRLMHGGGDGEGSDTRCGEPQITRGVCRRTRTAASPRAGRRRGLGLAFSYCVRY
jgi:hypothetical protein